MPGTTRYTVSKKVVEQRRNARLTHGARSNALVVPRTRHVKQSLLRRMGMRQAELSWAAREQLDLYARNKAKLQYLDSYFEANPLITANGEPAGAARIYWLAHNSATRSLAELRKTVEAMAREDARFDKALTALAAEGRAVREGRDDNGA